MNHATVGVYNNHTSAFDVVSQWDLQSYVEYNHTFRLQRALFVDSE